MVRDPQSGKYRRTRLFVLTLGYSRKSVRLLVFRSSAQTWAELHERAFRRLGGATRVVVLDNLREGVLTPDIYDPSLNPLYRDVLAHYGAVAMPCRVRDPDRKGKVRVRRRPCQENAAERAPLRESGRSASLPGSLGGTLGRYADSRHHQTASRRDVRRREAGAPAAAAGTVSLLPVRRANGKSGWVRGSGSGLLQRAARLDQPPGGSAVGRPHVRLLHPKTGQLLREHLRQERGRHRIKDEDRPKRTPLGTVQLLARAERTGSHIGTLSHALHRLQGEPAIRRIQGLLAFAKKYGVARVDDACAVALEVEAYDFRFVRRYLERNSRPPLSLRQVDPLIRQLHLCRDLIQERTKEPNP